MAKKPRIDYEERFWVALTRIKAYITPEQLRRASEKAYGLNYEEALEMAYDNVRGEAIAALHGYRRKKRAAPTVEQPQASSVRTHAGIDDGISGPTGQSTL